MPRSEDGLYDALEEELKKSGQPMDCVQLFEFASVRKYAASSNRVSDYLGNMWRKGVLTRLPAPRGTGSNARWLYAWKGRKTELPSMEQAVDFLDKHMILQRPNVEISEQGKNIKIELAELTITIAVR